MTDHDFRRTLRVFAPFQLGRPCIAGPIISLKQGKVSGGRGSFAQLHARAIASAKASMTAPPTTSPPATNLLSFTQPLRNYEASSYRAQYQTAKASFDRKFPSTRQLRAVLYINERRDITQNACSRGWGRKQFKALKTDSCFAANTPATLGPKIKKPRHPHPRN